MFLYSMLRESTILVLQEFLNQLSTKGFTNSNLNIPTDTAAPAATRGRKSKSVAATGDENKGGDS